MKRRTFIKNSTAVGAGSLILPFSLSAKSKYIPPSDRVRIGLIGAKGMGWSNTNSLLKIEGTELVGLCDVDDEVIKNRAGDYSKLRNNTPKIYKDYRKMLEDKSIDVVVIGTPDHWHCKMFVDALEAGKHVYVEKPIANTIEECQIMERATKRSGKMVQVGQWQRSGTHYKKAIEIVKSGKLGNIRLVKTWAYQGWLKPIPVLANEPVPAGVDYKMWLGPAPTRPFNRNRFHFQFRWFWDYAGGLMTDWGVHELDIALWGMGAKVPKSIVASGGKFAYPNDASETPDTLQTVFEYEKFNMLWEHATGIDIGPYNRREGIAFIGNNGTLVVDRGGFELLPEYESQGYSKEGEALMEPIEAMKRPEDVNYLDLHTTNFLNAIKNNDYRSLATPIEAGAIAGINAQMGNIAFRTGAKLHWNNSTGNFVKNKKANQMIKVKYHNGWKVPR